MNPTRSILLKSVFRMKSHVDNTITQKKEKNYESNITRSGKPKNEDW